MMKLSRKFTIIVMILIGWKNIFSHDLSKNLDEYILTKENSKKILINKFLNDEKMIISRKKYINVFQWNISEIFIFNEKNEINLKSVEHIDGINYIIFRDKKIKKIGDIKLSEKTIISLADDEIIYKEEVISKQNIVKNKKTDYRNPKIIKFNGKEIENPIIYEVTYKGYMFRIIGDEKLYNNQEIKKFIKYMKSLEKYF